LSRGPHALPSGRGRPRKTWTRFRREPGLDTYTYERGKELFDTYRTGFEKLLSQVGAAIEASGYEMKTLLRAYDPKLAFDFAAASFQLGLHAGVGGSPATARFGDEADLCIPLNKQALPNLLALGAALPPQTIDATTGKFLAVAKTLKTNDPLCNDNSKALVKAGFAP